MRIGVICNHEVALLTIQLLAHNNMLASVGVPGNNNELLHKLLLFCNDRKIDLHTFTKKGFDKALSLWLDAGQFDAVWIMTCPFIIPSSLLAITRFGFINFHYGLLPNYRGANPVFEQIKNREPYGGITIHHVDGGIDTGAIIMQQRIPVDVADTYAMHMSKLAMPCMEAAKRLLQMMMSGSPLPAFLQNEGAAHYYKRPSGNDVMIDWETMTADEIIALSNACNPWNRGAATAIKGMTIGILYAKKVAGLTEDGAVAGTIRSIDDNGGLQVVCADKHVLKIEMIYTHDGFLPGYALRNYNISTGDSFTALYTDAANFIN